MLFKSLLYTFIFVGSILPFSNSQAQNSDKINPLQKDSKALQFQISDNFNLDSFSGTTFSYKRQLSDAHAKRVGLSFSNTYKWRNFPDSEIDQKASDLNLNIGIDYTWMHYTNPDSEIKFYYGYGPGIDFGFYKSNQDGAGRKSTLQNSFYSVAGIGYAGVEWFFQSSMSLHAEYQGSLQVNHTLEKSSIEVDGNEEIIKSNSTTVRLGGDGVRFGLSVYF